MIITPKNLFPLLDEAQCDYQLFEHPPVFTVEDSLLHCTHIPGAQVKNLFLRDRKKKNYALLTVKDEKRVDLTALSEQLGWGRLSFVKGEELVSMLGVQPGSVTPLAIINDQSQSIKQLLDSDLLKEDYISIHPMVNTATICIRLEDLLAFIRCYRQEYIEFFVVPTMF